jgi:hypothetical protein
MAFWASRRFLPRGSPCIGVNHVRVSSTHCRRCDHFDAGQSVGLSHSKDGIVRFTLAEVDFSRTEKLGPAAEAQEAGFEGDSGSGGRFRKTLILPPPHQTGIPLIANRCQS